MALAKQNKWKASQQQNQAGHSLRHTRPTLNNTIANALPATHNPFQLSSCSSLCAPNANFNGPNPDSGAIVWKNYAACLINYVPNMKGTPEWVK